MREQPSRSKRTVEGGHSHEASDVRGATLAERAVLGDAQDVVSLAQDEVAEQAELERGAQERSRHAAQRSQASEDRRAAVADLAAADAEIAALRTALAQRAIIGQAVGIIMATERVDAQEAFSMLVRKSQSANVKVRDLAPQLVAQATRSWTADDRHS